MIWKPSEQLTVDCFVDADFAGQWNVDNPEDPLCVKSRTGYVLLFRNCPVQWVSRLQREISVSRMEAEYISLSMSMQNLFPLQTLVAEVKDLIGALCCHVEHTQKSLKTIMVPSSLNLRHE